MGKYFSTESEVYAHFQPFFESLLKNAEVGGQLREKKMSFRFITRDPGAEIALDARKGEGKVTTGEGEKNEDVLIQLRADLLHQLMLGKIRLMPAIMGRQISARGVMEKQKELGAMISTLSQLYKDYLNTNNKQDMLN
ncbi:MAG: SCP2 sterol-binding domain-containing protein [candidate division KSB1 bacterium]|nr:SCP2 sterol-binding domain-containing protein [candidate division KSB1 bacterium]MDQ7064069.1 SCP2 sterol-binding domain-containing protein [candidate division KSB1 bacterium]